jgi:hypothetical protein
MVSVFWDVRPYTLVKIYWIFGGTYTLLGDFGRTVGAYGKQVFDFTHRRGPFYLAPKPEGFWGPPTFLSCGYCRTVFKCAGRNQCWSCVCRLVPRFWMRATLHLIPVRIHGASVMLWSSHTHTTRRRTAFQVSQLKCLSEHRLLWLRFLEIFLSPGKYWNSTSTLNLAMTSAL